MRLVAHKSIGSFDWKRASVGRAEAPVWPAEAVSCCWRNKKRLAIITIIIMRETLLPYREQKRANEEIGFTLFAGRVIQFRPIKFDGH